jgi:hypothetical protein
MRASSLNAFVAKVRAGNRLLFGDLRRLQRDILPAGPATRRDVEALLELDRSIDRADEGWPAYLVAAVKAFVIGDSEAPGRVDRPTAEWLAPLLVRARPQTALAIVANVIREAEEVDDVLRRVTVKGGRPRAPRRIADDASPDGPQATLTVPSRDAGTHGRPHPVPGSPPCAPPPS